MPSIELAIHVGYLSCPLNCSAVATVYCISGQSYQYRDVRLSMLLQLMSSRQDANLKPMVQSAQEWHGMYIHLPLLLLCSSDLSTCLPPSNGLLLFIYLFDSSVSVSCYGWDRKSHQFHNVHFDHFALWNWTCITIKLMVVCCPCTVCSK